MNEKEPRWICSKCGKEVDTSTDGLLTNTHSHKEKKPQWRKIGESEYTEHWSLDGHSYIELGKKLKEHLLASERADWLRSEIEKLEEKMNDEEAKQTESTWEDGWKEGYIRAHEYIITRYKEELKVLESNS